MTLDLVRHFMCQHPSYFFRRPRSFHEPMKHHNLPARKREGINHLGFAHLKF
jgi:hypothetical protein